MAESGREEESSLVFIKMKCQSVQRSFSLLYLNISNNLSLSLSLLSCSPEGSLLNALLDSFRKDKKKKNNSTGTVWTLFLLDSMRIENHIH